ncbi:MAG: dehydrogenase [Candidatus Bathyarchaeota archaeon B26-2]|nr:MAG: dehydrogenase [Candidatus Bathyarchaeota archaeon B26-2]
MPIFTAEDLKTVGFEIFKAAGAPSDEARLVSEMLVNANLDGHDSHGVIRVLQYVKSIREGKIKPGVKVEVLRETPTTAVLNGNWGFGQVVATMAMRKAVEKAKTNAVSVVCATNCNHVGRLYDYTLLASKNGMIGISFANSISMVAPYGGMERRIGTCPMSFAFPTDEEIPFVIDIATSICAEGKIRVKSHEGKNLPYNCIVDKDGRLTKNPKALYEGGAILPMGGEVGYKGFNLGLVVEILGGILSGTGYSYSKKFRGGNGVFMEAINVEMFMDLEEFRHEVGELARAVRSSKPRLGFKKILTPGEIEFKTRERRLREGIPVPEKTWVEIVKIARELNLDIEGLVKSK